MRRTLFVLVLTVGCGGGGEASQGPAGATGPAGPPGDRGASAAKFRVLVEGSPRNLHPILRDELYCIAREALRNAFHHANAQHIEAEIAYGAAQLRLRIRDDGSGIDPEVLYHGFREGHWGLPGMYERAKRIGAQLGVWSKPGAGQGQGRPRAAGHA
jgi:signal transduction histidine kinase